MSERFALLQARDTCDGIDTELVCLGAYGTCLAKATEIALSYGHEHNGNPYFHWFSDGDWETVLLIQEVP